MEALPSIARAKHWSKPLVKRVKLASGDELATLADARRFILANFSDVLKDAVLEHACVLLMVAATSGRIKDCRRATDQIVILISTRPRL